MTYITEEEFRCPLPKNRKHVFRRRIGWYQVLCFYFLRQFYYFYQMQRDLSLPAEYWD